MLGAYAKGDDIHFTKDLINNIKGNVLFFCIGTDRNTGDSFAPLVGTMLKNKGYENVMGTIEEPIHALNLRKSIKLIPKDVTVISIDACLGKQQNVGNLVFEKGAITAGSAVNKKLPPVGDYAIKGIVNINSTKVDNFLILSSTRLYDVISLSNRCVSVIERVFPLDLTINDDICI